MSLKKVTWKRGNNKAIIKTGNKEFDRALIAPFNGNYIGRGCLSFHIRPWNCIISFDKMYEPGVLTRYDFQWFSDCHCPSWYLDNLIEVMKTSQNLSGVLYFFKTYQQNRDQRGRRISGRWHTVPQGAFFVTTGGAVQFVTNFNMHKGYQVLTGIMAYYVDLALPANNMWRSICAHAGANQ